MKIYIGSSKLVWYLHEAGDPNPSLMLLYHSLEHCLSAVKEASPLCPLHPHSSMAKLGGGV